MQFVASFIEYLVTGSLALLWLIPLCRAIWPGSVGTFLTEVSPSTIWTAIMLAVVYVFGLLLDFVAYKLMRSRRESIRQVQEELNRRYEDALKARGLQSVDDHALIWFKAPDLAKTLQAYSSRDRIARGATLNLAVAAIVVPLVLWSYPASPIVGAGFLALGITAYFAWFRFQSLSRELKKEAVITILEGGDYQKGKP